VTPPLGRPPRDREIVLFRACVRRAAFGCQEETSWQRRAFVFFLSPLASVGFPFPLSHKGASLFPDVKSMWKRGETEVTLR